jgi:hypothetical protein
MCFLWTNDQARRRNLYLTTQNTRKKEISITRWDSNPYPSDQAAAALDRADIGNGLKNYIVQ